MARHPHRQAMWSTRGRYKPQQRMRRGDTRRAATGAGGRQSRRRGGMQARAERRSGETGEGARVLGVRVLSLRPPSQTQSSAIARYPRLAPRSPLAHALCATLPHSSAIAAPSLPCLPSALATPCVGRGSAYFICRGRPSLL